MKSNVYAAPAVADRHLTEINYHIRLNVRLVLAAAPNFLLFTCFYYLRANFFQAGIYATLTITALAVLCFSYRVRDPLQLILLKQIAGTVAFGLLAGSLLAGALSKDIYAFLPWFFIYPVGVMLFFGERVGIACSLAFCLASAVVFCVIDLPSWNTANARMFKIVSLMALFSALTVAIISERTRVRMRNSLIDARNKYRAAEAHQRRTNAELKREITMRLHSEKALVESESRYRALFEESAVALWEEDCSRLKSYFDNLPKEAVCDLEGYFRHNPNEVRKCIKLMRVTAVNRATLELYEAGSKLAMMKNIWDVLPDDLPAYVADRLLAFNRGARYEAKVTAETLSGRTLHLLLGSAVPAGYEDTWEKVYMSVYDITDSVAMEEEKNRVERQLQHTRQIQAIASLAGGIAHQFNNALAVIWGNLDLLELKVPRGEKTKRHFHALRSSSEHIRRLTEQLLAYAKGGKYQPMDFSLNDLIHSILKANKITRQPAYRVTLNLEDEVTLAGGDVTQISMVLDAVLANAVEAMPEGGEIIINARYEQVADQLEGGGVVLPPGSYALITIEDHGTGMDEETRKRIFEPFFTTKFVGRGLGMAAAHGIVYNHDGFIEITSQPNQGTRVTICLPGAVPQAIPQEDARAQVA